MSKLLRCLNCGNPVNELEYDYIGARTVYACSDKACQQELRDANRAAHDDAAWEAADDGYSRYL